MMALHRRRLLSRTAAPPQAITTATAPLWQVSGRTALMLLPLLLLSTIHRLPPVEAFTVALTATETLAQRDESSTTTMMLTKTATTATTSKAERHFAPSKRGGCAENHHNSARRFAPAGQQLSRATFPKATTVATARSTRASSSSSMFMLPSLPAAATAVAGCVRSRCSIDAAAVVASVLLLIAYHVQLLRGEKTGERPTWRSVQADTREQWSRYVRHTENWLYAVQVGSVTGWDAR